MFVTEENEAMFKLPKNTNLSNNSQLKKSKALLDQVLEEQENLKKKKPKPKAKDKKKKGEEEVFSKPVSSVPVEPNPLHVLREMVRSEKFEARMHHIEELRNI